MPISAIALSGRAGGGSLVVSRSRGLKEFAVRRDGDNTMRNARRLVHEVARALMACPGCRNVVSATDAASDRSRLRLVLSEGIPNDGWRGRVEGSRRHQRCQGP